MRNVLTLLLFHYCGGDVKNVPPSQRHAARNRGFIDLHARIRI